MNNQLSEDILILINRVTALKGVNPGDFGNIIKIMNIKEALKVVEEKLGTGKYTASDDAKGQTK